MKNCIHIVNPLRRLTGGSEQLVLDLQRVLSPHAEVKCWLHHGSPDSRIESEYAFERLKGRVKQMVSPFRADPELAELTQATPIRPGIGNFPKGGVIVIVGTYYGIGDWIKRANPDRLILYHNTPGDQLFERTIGEAKEAGIEPEFVYASEQVAKRYLQYPGVVQPSPIDLQRFQPLRRESKDHFTVGRLSRDVPNKFGEEDGRLFRLLAKSGIKVRLMGGGQLRNELASVPGVEFVDEGGESAESFLGSLDAFVYRTHSGWFEAWGRVVAEAMACGLPVVCENRGGYTSFIENGADGFLFADTNEAVNIVSKLVHDESLRSRVGSAARYKVEQVLNTEILDTLIDFYISGRKASHVSRQA